MKNPVCNRQSGFTLMEMLVVISIIVILAGLSFGGFNYVKAKQAREQAKLQVKLLSLALEEYKADNGVFPENGVRDGKGGTTEIYKALYPQEANGKVYLPELNPENDPQGWLGGASGNGPHEILDPWGNEYRYRTNRSNSPRPYASNPDFDLWSVGPDGETEAGANGGYDPTESKNLDDIGW